MQETHADKLALMRQGVMVFLELAVLTGVEFAVATGHLAASLFFLALIALAKVALIGTYFMHAGKLFHAEEGEHE